MLRCLCACQRCRRICNLDFSENLHEDEDFEYNLPDEARFSISDTVFELLSENHDF